MKPRHIYLLTPPESAGGVSIYYSNLEALAADTTNGFGATTAAIRAARAKAGGYPVYVKRHRVDKLEVRGSSLL